MNIFSKLSIKYKIIFVSLIITIPSVLISSMLILYLNLNTFKNEIIQKSLTDAKLVNELIAAPMAFDYADQVYQIIEKLINQENILSIYVLNNKNEVISEYIKPGTQKFSLSLRNESEINSYRYAFDDINTLHIDYTISFETEKYGNLIIYSDTGITKYFWHSLQYIIIIGLIIGLLAYIVISRLQIIISAPIVELAEISQKITENQDYTITVTTNSKDEIGLLYNQYQKMLYSLQTKEKENREIVDKLKQNQQTLIKTQAIARIGSWERNFLTNEIVWSDEEYQILEQSKHLIPTFDAILENIYPADKQNFLNNWEKALKFGAEYNIEFRYMRNSGIKWLQEKAEIYFDKNGKALKALGYTYDVTKRKEQELELLKHRNNLEELVQHRTNEIIQLYSDIAFKNELLYKINSELNSEKLKVVEQSEKINSVNSRLLKKAQELENTLGKLKSAQSQLVQQEKMASLGTLTAGIAHEINNPINFISSNMMGLETLLFELKEQFDNLAALQPENGNIIKEINSNINLLINNIKIGINRTVEIIKSLRTFSRDSKENYSNANINDNLDSTLLLLKNQYKDKIEIIKEYGHISPVFCSIGQINQVFMNLILNAIQAITDAGVIKIKTTEETNFLKITIEDSGKGIPEDIKNKIFEPFFTTKEIGKGTGLGLSISYNIIKNHKGEIKVESTIGKGTSFFVFLPLNEKA